MCWGMQGGILAQEKDIRLKTKELRIRMSLRSNHVSIWVYWV